MLQAALTDDPDFEANHPDDWEILLERAGVSAEEARAMKPRRQKIVRRQRQRDTIVGMVHGLALA